MGGSTGKHTGMQIYLDKQGRELVRRIVVLGDGVNHPHRVKQHHYVRCHARLCVVRDKGERRV